MHHKTTTRAYRALAAAHRFAAATGPVTLPIIIGLVALEVLS